MPATPPPRQPACPRPRVIKRYANRKLYDTAERLFTSLAAIRAMVRDGVDIVVVDHSSGQDRTAETLGQALSRQPATDRADPLDPAMLAELIRAPGRLAEALAAGERDNAEIRAIRSEVLALSRVLDHLLAQVPDDGQ
jgi:polyhydroxyalkanoate synthesis repressor PhaR